MSDEVFGEKCGLVVTKILQVANEVMSGKNSADVQNVAVVFTPSNCVQFRKMKGHNESRSCFIAINRHELYIQLGSV